MAKLKGGLLAGVDCFTQKIDIVAAQTPSDTIFLFQGKNYREAEADKEALGKLAALAALGIEWRAVDYINELEFLLPEGAVSTIAPGEAVAATDAANHQTDQSVGWHRRSRSRLFIDVIAATACGLALLGAIYLFAVRTREDAFLASANQASEERLSTLALAGTDLLAQPTKQRHQRSEPDRHPIRAPKPR